MMKLPSISRLLGTKAQDDGWFACDFVANGAYTAQVDFSGARPKVTRCSFHLADAMSGEVLERLSRDADFPKKQITTLLSFGEYQMLMVEAPVVPADELKTAIRWKIKDALSFHVEDATIDVLQIPKQGAERMTYLFAIAAENSVIQQKIAMFERAKLDLNVIDIRETAQRNIATLYEQNERAVVLLVFDEKGGLMTFSSGGELYMSRRIEIGVDQLCEVDEELLSQAMNRIELELQRSLDYFDRQYNHIPISRLLVSAPSASGLISFLSGTMDIKVEQLDLSQVMDTSAVAELSNQDFLMNAIPVIGAALRQERRAL